MSIDKLLAEHFFNQEIPGPIRTAKIGKGEILGPNHNDRGLRIVTTSL